MKKTFYLLCILLALSLLFFFGCSIKEKQAVKKTVTDKFEQLKSSDSTAIQDHMDTKDLLPESLRKEISTQDVADILSLFYQDFSYKIKDTSVRKDSATVTVKLRTIDAKALAKDLSKAALSKRIHHHIDDSLEDFHLNDSYLILKELMQNKQYDTTAFTTKVMLEKKEKNWQIIHTSELDSALTGHFLVYTSNPNVLSPEEIVEVHFDAMKNCSAEQLKTYLNLDQFSDTVSEYHEKVADALAKQIKNSFDYKLIGQKIQENNASVQVCVTSIDFQNILNSYKKKVSKWLKTSEALSVGATGRREKEKELFLSCIQKNKKNASREISIPLTNDGFNWKIQMDSSITEAIFGDISNLLNMTSYE